LTSLLGVAEFRLIDPPRVSPKPVSPNRLLLLPLVLAASLASGLFFAFAASQVRPTFGDAAELRAKTGLPLLGIVTMLTTEADRQKIPQAASIDFYLRRAVWWVCLSPA
jgi:capsular polysaccharide biosynthesis protein